MKLFGFILSIFGIPASIAVSFHQPVLGIVLTVLQIPNLVLGIMCLTSPTKYE